MQQHVPVFSIGTLGAFLNDKPIATKHTTPDPPQLYAAMALARDHGVKIICMEVSSHAIAQGKLAPCRFALAGFTSFSQDHLDFHANLEEYFSTKMQLFTICVHQISKSTCINHCNNGSSFISSMLIVYVFMDVNPWEATV